MLALEELREPERRACGPRSAALVGGAGLLGGAGGEHRVDPGVDPARELGPVDDEPDEQCRMAQPRGPQSRCVLVPLDPGAFELGQARDPLPVARGNAGGERRLELGVKRLRAALGDLGLDLGANLGGHGRAQVEIGERRAQIQPGSADDDRATPVREKPVDLGVCELRVAAGAELLGGIEE